MLVYWAKISWDLTLAYSVMVTLVALLCKPNYGYAKSEIEYLFQIQQMVQYSENTSS